MAASPSLKFFYLQSLSSKAPYNETHWKNTSWNDLLFKAIGETDDATAQQTLEPGADRSSTTRAAT